MSNMSYCRFRNTSMDASDCLEALREFFDGQHEALTREELQAAIDLTRTARKIVERVALFAGVDDPDDFTDDAISDAFNLQQDAYHEHDREE